MRLTPTIVQAEAVVCRKSRASERGGERERAQQRNTTNNSSDGDDGHHNNNNYNYNSSIKPTLLCVRACVCRRELILNLLRSLFHQQEDEQHDSTARDWWLNESKRKQGRARVAESKKVMRTHYLDPTTSIITFMDPGGFQLQLRTATFRKFSFSAIVFSFTEFFYK